MGVTAKPKTSRQNQKPHGKTKYLTAKSNTSRQNQKPSRQNKKPHGKNKKPNRVHGGSDFFDPSYLCVEGYSVTRQKVGF